MTSNNKNSNQVPDDNSISSSSSNNNNSNNSSLSSKNSFNVQKQEKSNFTSFKNEKQNQNTKNSSFSFSSFNNLSQDSSSSTKNKNKNKNKKSVDDESNDNSYIPSSSFSNGNDNFLLCTNSSFSSFSSNKNNSNKKSDGVDAEMMMNGSNTGTNQNFEAQHHTSKNQTSFLSKNKKTSFLNQNQKSSFSNQNQNSQNLADDDLPRQDQDQNISLTQQLENANNNNNSDNDNDDEHQQIQQDIMQHLFNNNNNTDDAQESPSQNFEAILERVTNNLPNENKNNNNNNYSVRMQLVTKEISQCKDEQEMYEWILENETTPTKLNEDTNSRQLEIRTRNSKTSSEVIDTLKQVQAGDFIAMVATGTARDDIWFRAVYEAIVVTGSKIECELRTVSETDAGFDQEKIYDDLVINKKDPSQSILFSSISIIKQELIPKTFSSSSNENNNNNNKQCCERDLEIPNDDSLEFGFQSSCHLKLDECNEINSDPNPHKFEMDEDDVMIVLEGARKAATFVKIIFWRNDINKFVNVLAEVIDINKDNNNNNNNYNNNNNHNNNTNYRLKIICSPFKQDLLADENHLISLPNDMYNENQIIIHKIKCIPRPLERIPDFQNIVPQEVSVLARDRYKHVIYVSHKTEKIQNTSGLVAGIGIVIHRTKERNINNNNFVINRYLPYADSEKTVKLVAIEAAALIYNKFLQDKSHDPAPVLVVYDDQDTFKFATTTTNFKGENRQEHIKIRNNYASLVDYRLHHGLIASIPGYNNKMDRYNPAHEVAVRTITTTRTVQNVVKGMEIIKEPHFITQKRNNYQNYRQEQNSKAATENQHVDLSLKIEDWASGIDSLEKFAELKRFKTRTRVPNGTIKREFGNIVSMVLAKVVNATTVEDRSKYLRIFMLLPTLFLPLRVSTSQILRHLVKAEPFNIDMNSKKNINNNNNNKSQVQHLQNTKKRVARQVETLARDQKVKKATQLMMSISDIANQQMKNEMMGVEDVNRNINNIQDPEEAFDESVKKIDAKNVKMKPGNEVKPMNFKVPPLDKKMVYEVLKKMSKHAATSIEGWTRDLLLAAMTTDHSISENLGIVLVILVSLTISLCFTCYVCYVYFAFGEMKMITSSSSCLFSLLFCLY